MGFTDLKVHEYFIKCRFLFMVNPDIILHLMSLLGSTNPLNSNDNFYVYNHVWDVTSDLAKGSPGYPILEFRCSRLRTA